MPAGYVSISIDELKAILPANRSDFDVQLVAGEPIDLGEPPSWYEWYVYHSSMSIMSETFVVDNFHFIQPAEGVGIWVRTGINVSFVSGWSFKLGDYTASPNDKLIIPSTNPPVNITLPPFPSHGTEVRIIGLFYGESGTSINVLLSGQKYQFTNNVDLSINAVYEEVAFIYTTSGTGWVASKQSIISTHAAPGGGD